MSSVLLAHYVGQCGLAPPGCGRCNRIKACPHEKIYPILATYPLEVVHIDFLMIKNPRNGKDMNVLVITDYFTMYA